MSITTAIRSIILTGTIVVHPAIPFGYGCTIFNVTHNGRTYVAANEDWTTDRFYLQVKPAEGTKYGVFAFGVDDPDKSTLR